MFPVFEMLVALAVFGGLAVLGLLVLVVALFAARRAGSIVACAVAAALLFAVQIGFHLFWYRFGAGFSGGDRRAETILWGSALVAIVMVGGFLAFKLTHPGGSPASPAWWRDGARVAALILAAYIVYSAGFLVLRQRYPYAEGAVPPSLYAWLPALIAVALAWGLWLHRRWAWLAAVVVLAASLAWTAWSVLPYSTSVAFLLMSTPIGVGFLLKLAALLVLLVSNARKLCAQA